MSNLDLTDDQRADKQAALSPGTARPVPTRRPFQFVYVGDAALARECFARSRSIEIIEVAPGPNTTLDRLPPDVRSGGPLAPDVLFIEHGYPGVDTHAILKDLAARRLHVLVVIVADWNDEFAARSFTLGADDYVVKSKASFRAVAFRMGRLLALSAHLKAHHGAEADDAMGDTLAREVAAAKLAVQGAELRHAFDMSDAAAQLAAARAAADMFEGKRREAVAALTRAEARAVADRRFAADTTSQRQAEFDRQLAAAVAERQLLAKQLAGAVTARQQADEQHASEIAQAVEQLAATKRQAEAQTAETAAAMSALQRTLDDTAARLFRVEQQAAKLSEVESALARAEERHRVAIAAAAEHLADQQQQTSAAVDALETKLRDAVTTRQEADERRASEKAEAARQLDAAKRQAEEQAAETAAAMTATQRKLDDTGATLARVEQQAAKDRQAAIDAGAERQATFDTELAREVARREKLSTKLSDVEAASAQAKQRQQWEMAAAAASLNRVEERAAVDREAAAAAALRRKAEFDTQLAAEVAERELLAKQLADAVAARQQADEQHASAIAAAAAQLAATTRQAETHAAETAAAMTAIQRKLDDTAATLARVEQQAEKDRHAALDAAAERQATFETELTQAEERAAIDRQAAADAAFERQAEFDTRLAAEVAEGELLTKQLAGTVTALQQANERRASEQAEAATLLAATQKDGEVQLAAAKRQAEAQAAESAAAMTAIQRRLADTAATLSRVEQQAAADRQAALDAAAERQAEFDAQLSAEVAKRELVAERLAGTVTALQQAEKQRTSEQAEAAMRLAATKKDGEAQLARSAAAAADALRQADARAAVDRQTASDAAVQRQAEFDSQLAAAKRQAEAQAAEMAEAMNAIQHKLDDTAATLTRVQQQAAEDRQAAIEAAVHRQAAFETELAQEVARREALASRLSDVEAALAQAKQRLQWEMAAAAATLKRAEERAAVDRQAAADRASQQQTEFDNQLAAEVAGRQLGAKQLAQTVAALQKAEQEHRRRFDHAPVSICRSTPDGTISLANHAFARFLGYDGPEELHQVDLASNVFETAGELQWLSERCLASRSAEWIDTTWIRKDGSRIIVRVRAVATTPDSLEIVPEDITTLRVLEDKLRVAQRMEAVARYASEVAVTCDNLLRRVEEEGRRWLAGSGSEEARYHGELLLEDVTRAAKYLDQLRVYGNAEKKVPGPVDLNKVLKDLEPVLKRVAGRDIDLVLPAAAPSLNLDVEEERVERMLVNVAAYGRERMPLGGQLMFQVAPTVVDRSFAEKYPNVRPGAHVLLTVNETRGAPRPDLVAAVRSQTPGTDAPVSGSSSPGVDLGTLQALVSGCGGHLWMTAEPQGDMVLKIHLPRRASDRPDPRAGVKPPARARWRKGAAGLQN